MKIVNILGIEYRIIIKKMDEDEGLVGTGANAYCDHCARRIIIADFEDNKYFKWENEDDKDRYAKRVIRHEIIHAFFSESGLGANSMVFDSAWIKNEEMVDWIAIQFPKMLKAFKEVGCE